MTLKTKHARITINMPYQSQDFQSMCADYIGASHLPPNLLKAASQYHPRLHRLLVQNGQKVFESDIELLANFIQTHPEAQNYSPNTLAKLYNVKQGMHQTLRKMNQARIDQKHARSTHRLKRVQQQMSKIKQLRGAANPAMKQEINQALKRFSVHHYKTQAERRAAAADVIVEISGIEPKVAQLYKRTMIKKARTQNERRERADELVHDMVDYRSQKSGRSASDAGAEADTSPRQPALNQNPNRPPLIV